jgi:hypothetical protein
MIYEDESLVGKLAKKAAWEIGFYYGIFWLIDKYLPSGSKSESPTIKLYKTDERHHSGYDVYRPVNTSPKSNQYGLDGEYYLFVGPSGTGILSWHDQERLKRGEKLKRMYRMGKAHRTHDGEPEYEIHNYEIVIK